MIPERRQTIRVDCCYQISCSIQGEELGGSVSDMGLGGMRLLIPRRLPNGTIITLEQKDLGSGAVEARVIWTRQLRSGEVETGLAYEGPPARLEQSWIKPALQRLGFEIMPEQERRQHVRVNLSAAGHLNMHNRQIPCTVVDLGLGGALVEGPPPLDGMQAGDTCMLTVQIPDCEPLAASLVYLNEVDTGWRGGLRFEPDRLTRAQARLVEGYLSALG